MRFRILTLSLLGALLLTPSYGQVVVGQLTSDPGRGGYLPPAPNARTLIDPVTIEGTVRDSTGFVLAQFSNSYPPNYFSQMPLSAFINPAVPTANSTVSFSVGGDAIVYSTTTDNHTNDSAIYVAQPTP